MYNHDMIKKIESESDFERITEVLKANRIARYMRVKGGYVDLENGEYRVHPMSINSNDMFITTDLKTLISVGLFVMVHVGNYKHGSPRRYNICKELGFELEDES